MTYSEKVEVELVWDGERETVRAGDFGSVFGARGKYNSYPEHVYDAARRVYDANRELAEGETRFDGEPWTIGKMSVVGDQLRIEWPAPLATVFIDRSGLDVHHAGHPERLAYFDAHYKPELGEDEIEHHGVRETMRASVFGNRPTVFLGRTPWLPFDESTALSPENAARAQAYWRKHYQFAPGERFNEETKRVVRETEVERLTWEVKDKCAELVAALAREQEAVAK